ncbi:MAG: 30S ribosomal protein S12 methylthiotransferase RimO [Coriobacteriia bacterium]|nr:30S ribosomal protein S12 methylthiotransferase RimO [Coriobacteriia bacterium]
MSDAPAIAFVTLGCPKNEVDSDRMAASVASSAYRLTDDVNDADVVVLNTCAFIQPATEEAIGEAFELITAWRPLKDGRRVVIAGCLVSRYADELVSAMPEADAFVSVADEPGLLGVLEALTGVAADARPGPTRTRPGTTAYLKVSEGCDRRCAYCTIPSIRGPFVSAEPASVLSEARALVADGARELVLVGQDIARYGHDLASAMTLAELITGLDSLEGDFRIRLMYLQPDGVTDHLLQAIAASSRVCRYLDIPLQHAAAPVLRAMKRSGDAARHLQMLQRVRNALPGVTLRTTVMAGFPGETDADAAELEAFLGEAGFDYAGVFQYSAEEGTPAALLPGQVPDDVAAERAQRLRDIADAVGFAKAAARVGTVDRVLVEGVDEDGETWGRSCAQAPEIDGITFLEADASAGTMLDVLITESVGYDLVGVAQ